MGAAASLEEIGDEGEPVEPVDMSPEEEEKIRWEIDFEWRYGV